MMGIAGKLVVIGQGTLIALLGRTRTYNPQRNRIDRLLRNQKPIKQLTTDRETRSVS